MPPGNIDSEKREEYEDQPGAGVSGLVDRAGGLTPLRATALVCLVLASAKLALHVAFIHGYGYFRDEFYYLALGRHLDWGYVDVAPFTPAVARLFTTIFGDGLFGIRLPVALAGAVLVALTCWLARELGGGVFAQAFAGLCAIAAPVWLSMHHILNNNAFEPLFFAGCALVLVRMIQTGNTRLWIWFGVVAGAGMMNKNSMALVAFALVAGLLLSPARRLVFSGWLLAGGAVAFLVFLPDLAWQAARGFPMLEFMRNADRYKNLALSPLQFSLTQIQMMNPVVLPVWIVGLGWLLFSKPGARHRALGWAYVTAFVLLVLTRGKAYYLVPAYPPLLAAGAVAIGLFAARPGLAWLKPAAAVIVLIAAIALAPFGIPVLPVQKYIRYADALGVQPSSGERHRLGPLPQFYADMFGWQEMAAYVAGIYHRLPPDEQVRAVVATGNYGEAGAIDYFARRYDLPPAISGHLQYYLWGPGRAKDPVIILGGRLAEHRKIFEDVERAGTFTCQYCMPYENDLAVWVVRKPRVDIAEVWPKAKHYE